MTHLSAAPILPVLAIALAAVATGCSYGGAAPQSSAAGDQRVESMRPVSTAVPTPTSVRGKCALPSPNLAAVAALQPSEQLACYGGTPLTFRALVSAAIVDCVPIDVEPAWLWCPPAALLVPATSGGFDSTGKPILVSLRMAASAAAAGPSSGLSVYVMPGSGIGPGQLPSGALVRVSGHFDDPAAWSCHVVAAASGWETPSAAAVVETCREAFVVTDVQPEAAAS